VKLLIKIVKIKTVIVKIVKFYVIIYNKNTNLGTSIEHIS